MRNNVARKCIAILIILTMVITSGISLLSQESAVSEAKSIQAADVELAAVTEEPVFFEDADVSQPDIIPADVQNYEEESVPEYSGPEVSDVVKDEDIDSEITDEPIIKEVGDVLVGDVPTVGWKDGFYYDFEGNLVTDQIIKIGDKVYIFDSRGACDLYNDIWIDGGNVYLVKDGVIDTESLYIYNRKAYKNGSLFSGGYQSYYYQNGVRVTTYKNVVRKVEDGQFYYFTQDGKIYRGTGWLRLNGLRYYIKDGVACTNWAYVDGYKYYFYTSSAILCQDLIGGFPAQRWGEKVTLIKVNRKMNCVTLYAQDGSNGAIIPVKSLICSVGLPATPTITGTYTLTAARTYRWAKLGGPTMGGYCYGQYCTRIHGSYLFHSVTYAQKNSYTLSSTAYNNLGNAASHGCVRLQVIDAKTIYDIVRHHNVTVTIYDSSTVGPFDKPVISKIPKEQRWEPTDPNV